MDDECRQLRRQSRRLERRYRKTLQPADQLACVESGRKRHKTYRWKENTFWNLRLAEQSSQPRKLWQSIAAILRRDKSSKSFTDCLWAQQLVDYFNEKIGNVRNSADGNMVLSSLAPSMSTLEKFEECTLEEIYRTIMASQSKSCELDPLPTSVLKEFLSDILPFMVDMCNASIRQGNLPVSRRHVITTPRL